ncbi:MAG: prolyl oligopeptidase family serine peptidase [Marinilabiliales bacterium]|nr:prolyl oligopeptidase family serine peptidase [Marinilabiliales bacterium]
MKRLVLLLILPLWAALRLGAQENITYQKPSEEIMKLVDYQRAPGVLLDDKKEFMLFTYTRTYKTLEDLSQPEMQLAGLRVNPVCNVVSAMTYVINLKVRKLADKEPIQVQGLPENPKIAFLSWSPDDKKVAFVQVKENGTELWVLDVATATATRLCSRPLNANLGRPFTWYADSRNLLVRLIPEQRPALLDVKKGVPAGPIVSVSDGSASQNRTYPDMLKNKVDEANFETLVTSELFKVSLEGSMDKLCDKDLYTGESFSPDGKYLMVQTLHKPFSYIVPLSRFPSKNVVYDERGKAVKVVNEVPLTEVMAKGFMAVRKGKRNLSWRSDKPATLCFVEALDEGNPAKPAEFRDAVYLWEAPFQSDPTLLVKTKDRFDNILWGNEKVAILSDSWYDTRNERTLMINPSDPTQAPRVICSRNSQDIYSDPGNFETGKNSFGREVLTIEKDQLFLIGSGFTKSGQFPFVDQLSVNTLAKKRIWQSTYTDKMLRILAVKDWNKKELLVHLQSKTDYPNYFLLKVGKKDQLTALTAFPNPFESLRNVEKSLIHYKRKDGVDLAGTLYLPAGYDKTKKEKLPLLIWAYPAEYKDKNSAGQTALNPNEFTFPYYGSFVYWVTKGYAVLDDAAFPIIGEGKTEPNDTFVSQLVANAEAAIHAVDSLGYIDPKRVAVGGHSYGAFMTANLLTHSKLFACGVARSGAYNRTLTPFGFQNEQRNYWEAPEVYNAMSPFMNAEKMKAPLLLVHGEADNNPGTFTLQTERYFQALKGLGAPVRMVLLPKEAHSYVARENILHLLWEQDQLFEKYLKGKK